MTSSLRLESDIGNLMLEHGTGSLLLESPLPQVYGRQGRQTLYDLDVLFQQTPIYFHDLDDVRVFDD